MRRTRVSWEGLLDGIDRCRGLVGRPTHMAALAPDVSGWSVAHHVEHLVRVDRAIVDWIGDALANPDRWPAAGRPSRIGRMVLASGWIPRGQGRAPDFTRPEGRGIRELAADLAALETRAERVEGRLEDVRALPCTRRHPVLGEFRASEWLRFLAIHHRHHDRIIRDILRRAGI